MALYILGQMASWTCQGCRTKHPRTRQKCDCGRRRPKRQKPKHLKALEVPYEEYVERFGEQCGICGCEPSQTRRLDRDHDHKTGEPRGLLCHLCNRHLSNRVDAEWLDRAAEYLRRVA